MAATRFVSDLKVPTWQSLNRLVGNGMLYELEEVRTMSEARLRSFEQRLFVQLWERMGHTKGSVVREELHVLRDDGLVVTRSSTVDDRNGTTYLSGLVETVPFYLESQLHLTKPEWPLLVCQAKVLLDMTDPVSLKHEWDFQIDSNSVTQLGSKSVTQASASQPPSSSGLDYWCVGRCGGKAILKCLLGCLPTLIGDPTGVLYHGCVLACAGGSWLSVVDCVLDNCM
jgi:hypothetical protein